MDGWVISSCDSLCACCVCVCVSCRVDEIEPVLQASVPNAIKNIRFTKTKLGQKVRQVTHRNTDKAASILSVCLSVCSCSP